MAVQFYTVPDQERSWESEHPGASAKLPAESGQPSVVIADDSSSVVAAADAFTLIGCLSSKPLWIVSRDHSLRWNTLLPEHSDTCHLSFTALAESLSKSFLAAGSLLSGKTKKLEMLPYMRFPAT